MARPAGKFAPTAGCLLGTFTILSPDWVSFDQAKADVASREAWLGRKYRIDHHFRGFDDPSWPGTFEQWDADGGRMPMIAWEMCAPADILAGGCDAYLSTLATQLKGFAKPIFLRFGAEPNGSWEAWNASHYGNDASRYVAAWRYAYAFLQKAGVTNAAWVWSPNCNDVPAEAWNHWTAYYPGDAYVDWVGIDGYNWGGSTWADPATIFGPVYKDYATRKPIMLAEIASAECAGGGGQCKATWINTLRTYVKTHTSITALVWFDMNKEHDWRVTSSTPVANAWRQLANDPYFR